MELFTGNSCFALLLALFICTHVAAQELEFQLEEALRNNLDYASLTISASPSEDDGRLNKLILKFEGIHLGMLRADVLTIFISEAEVDRNALEQGEFILTSAASQRAVMLLSKLNLEEYLQNYFADLGKQDVEIDLTFAPPFIETRYKAAKKEFAEGGAGMLGWLLPGDHIEGYGAFRLSVVKDQLSVILHKVIVNHFLLPRPVVDGLHSLLKNFDAIPALQTFNFSFNEAAVQPKYLLIKTN